MTVHNEKELAQAVKNCEDTIEIEGDLGRKVLRIKATGKIAWMIAVGAIGVAVVAVLAAPATGGTSSVVAALSAPAALTILGGPVTAAAISIAVAGGGVAILSKLRSYKVVSKADGLVTLKKS